MVSKPRSFLVLIRLPSSSYQYRTATSKPLYSWITPESLFSSSYSYRMACWFLPATFAYFTDHRHFRYLRHYWKMHEAPRNLDAYNQPVPEHTAWCNFRCVLRKETEP